MKRLLSVLLAVLLAGTCFASCSDSGNSDTPAPGEPAPAAAGEIPETEPVPEETVIPDNLPDVDYEGYTFHAATFSEEIGVEEETGEALNDALFRRDEAVEERFGVVLEGVKYGDYTAATNAVKQAVSAGTNDFDCGFLHMVSAASTASGGYFYSINQLDAVDPTKPWWDTDCVDAFTVAGNMKLICGIVLPNAMLRSSCLAFNKNRFNDYGKEYPYSIVDAGEWTLDEMYEQTKDMTTDLNGDGQIRETDDFFGLTSWYLDSPYSFYYGAGGTICVKDEEDRPVINEDLEFNTAVYEKIYKIVRDNQSNYHTDINTYSEAYNTFIQGRALFCEASLTHFKGENFREMEDDYGVLPMPKYNADQSQYMSFVNGAVAMVAVPKSIEDPERTGILLEGLASESWKHVREALFEVTAKAKSARDEDSTRMMDLVMAYRVFDFGYAHMYDQGGVNFVRDLLASNSTDVASTLQRSQKVMQKVLEKCVEAYEKNG